MAEIKYGPNEKLQQRTLVYHARLRLLRMPFDKRHKMDTTSIPPTREVHSDKQWMEC